MCGVMRVVFFFFFVVMIRRQPISTRTDPLFLYRALFRSRVAARRLLLDADRGRQAVDMLDVGLLHHLEELARIGRQALDIAPLPLGIDGVEGEARFS